MVCVDFTASSQQQNFVCLITVISSEYPAVSPERMLNAVGLISLCRKNFSRQSLTVDLYNMPVYVTFGWPRGYKTFFVLNSVEHEILNAHKYKNIKKFGLFKAQLSLECYFSRSYMLKCQQLLAF